MVVKAGFPTGSALSVVYPLVLTAGSSTPIVADTSGTTRWLFSKGMNGGGATGYYKTGQFSSDDGIWGVNVGADAAGGTGGVDLNSAGSNTFGFGNYDGGDSVGYYYWDNVKVSTANFVAACFTGAESPACPTNTTCLGHAHCDVYTGVCVCDANSPY